MARTSIFDIVLTVSMQPDKEHRVAKFVEELLVDALITAAIVWGFVLLGEPLVHVLKSPIFIALTVGGLARLIYKTLRPKKPADA